jgi:predicted HTH transcriptional regulator
MERRGSGLKKIIKEYDDKELPVFYSDQQFFVVTLKNQNYINPENCPENCP